MDDIQDRLVENELSSFFNDLADAARRIALAYFRSDIDFERKQDLSPVTIADQAIEQELRQLISARFPGHGILGEETGSTPGDRYTWYLDPIDGTKSFISGMPMWGTLIGLLRNGEPTYGMMVQPFTRERFVGDCIGARWYGPGHDHALIERKLRARSCADFARATLMTTSPLLYPPPKLEAFRRIERAVRLSRYGCDCYAFAMLAAGHVDCVIECGVQTYDIAPLIPIVQGAGGMVTAWDGGSAVRGGDVIASGDARVHDAALKLLNS